MRRLAWLAFALSAAGCAAIPSGAKTTVLSLEHLPSGQSAAELGAALSRDEGVYKVLFDKQAVELKVIADPSFDALRAATAARDPDEDYAIAMGAGKGSYAAWQAPPTGADVEVLNDAGADVPDLFSHVVQGKITLVDFSAKWCEPCRQLDAYVLDLMSRRSDLAYRKLDVADWDSPIVTHYMADEPELPFVIVFGTKGNEIARISGFDTDKLRAAIDAAAIEAAGGR